MHPAPAPNLPQLQNQVDRGIAFSRHVDVVDMWRSIRGVRHCTELQYTSADPATVLLLVVPGQLGTV